MGAARGSMFHLCGGHHSLEAERLGAAHGSCSWEHVFQVCFPRTELACDFQRTGALQPSRPLVQVAHGSMFHLYRGHHSLEAERLGAAHGSC